MSPHAALDSPVFRGYVLLVAGILALAGALIFVIGRACRRDVRSVWVTYRSWLVMAPVAAGVVFAGRVPLIAGVTALSLFAFREFARATRLAEDRWMTRAACAGIAAVGAASVAPDPGTATPGWLGMFLAVPVYAISLLLVIPILRNRTQGQLQAASLATLGFVYVGWMLGHLGFLANAPHAYGYVLYLLLATEVNDVAAFTAGRLAGRRPLRSAISPKKTWEGALGALAVSMALPWALRFSFPHFSPLQLVLTGLIVGVGGQLGDLAVSVIKRDVGIKDMGAAIPGHGGVLDRIDSLVFVAPLFFHMVNHFHGVG